MTSKKLRTDILLLIVVCFTAIYSCKKFNNDWYFTAEIESISLPNSAYAGDSVSIFLKGYLGPTSCYVFSEAYLGFHDDDTTVFIVEVLGAQVNSQVACYEEESRFNHEIKIYFENTGEYTFVTMQSGNLVELGKIIIKELGIEQESFIAKIEGVFAPSIAFVDDPVPVHIYGYLGPTSCYTFDYAEFFLQDNNNVLIEAFGILESGDVDCKNTTSIFNDELNVVFPASGEYTFVTMWSNTLTELGKIVITHKP